MKNHTFGIVTLLLFVMVIGLTSVVYADPGVNATPETQLLSTVTSADVVGITMETDAGVWTTTNSGSALHTLVNPGEAETMRPPSENLEQVLGAGGSYILLPTDPGVVISLSIPESLLDQQRADGSGHTWREFIAQSITLGWIYSASQGGIHTGALDPGQVQYTTAYDANIVAQGGKTSFIKQMTIDTRNKVASQSNLKAQTGLTFAATSDGGNVVGSENLMLDGAGDTIDASDRMLCPFISQPDPYIPTFCNIIQAGSKYDLTIGSVTTNVDERFVGTDATDPVVMNYAINIKPYSTTQGQFPASGSAMAYIKAHTQEARDCLNCKAGDMVYSESASAQGIITAFNKEMHYASQVTGPLPTRTPVPLPDTGPINP